MKQTVLVKSAVLAGSALFAGFALAGDPAPKAAIAAAPSSDLEVTFGVGYTDEYVFRNQNRGNDLVETSIGVSGNGNLGGLGDIGLSAGLWIGTYEADRSASRSFSTHEMRINMEASKCLGSFAVAVGVTNYSFFGGSNAADILEPYVGLSTEMAGLSLGAAAHFDENETAGAYDDVYWELTAGKGFAISDNATLNLTGFIGINDEPDETFYGVNAGLGIAVSDNITLTPHVSAVFGDTRSDDDEFTAGVNLGFGF